MLSVPEDRVAAIRAHPKPKSRRQLRSFLGMVGFYRRFICDFHRFSFVLTPHMSKSLTGDLIWSDSMVSAFTSLCNVLCNSVSLHVPTSCDSFVLECDACATGIGSVLSIQRDKVLLPVGFFSRQLRGAQSRYSAQEL